MDATDDLDARLGAMTRELAALAESVNELADPRDRAECLHALDMAAETIGLRDREHGMRPGAVDSLDEAIMELAASVRRPDTGDALTRTLMGVCWRLGVAWGHEMESVARRAAVTSSRPATATLALLAQTYPEAPAAALNRMLKSAIGRSLDESAARAIVRKARMSLNRGGVK